MTKIILSHLEQTFKQDIFIQNLIRTGRIPLFSANWMDERLCCARARSNDSRQATGCPALASNSNGTTWCRLNGAERGSNCVFDEPDSADIWQRIRQQQNLANDPD